MRKSFRAAIREVFVSPAFFILLGLVAVSPFIICGALYVFLRSFIVVPSGILAWASLALFIAGGVASLGYLFWIERPRRKSELATLGIRSKPNLWPIVSFYLALKMTIGTAVALSFWTDMRSDDGSYIVKGKVIRQLPKDRLKSTLMIIERDGIFTWILKE